MTVAKLMDILATQPPDSLVELHTTYYCSCGGGDSYTPIGDDVFSEAESCWVTKDGKTITISNDYCVPNGRKAL